MDDVLQSTEPSVFAKLPAQLLDRSVTILLVGNPGVGKQTFGNLLVQHAQNINANVRTAVKLPLQPDPNRPRIDFIVFMLNLTSLQSLTNLQQSLKVADQQYFLGRCCILATHADRVTSLNVSVDSLEALAFRMQTPLFFVNLLHLPSGAAICSQVLKRASVSAGAQPLVSPLLFSIAIPDEVATSKLPS